MTPALKSSSVVFCIFLATVAAPPGYALIVITDIDVANLIDGWLAASTPTERRASVTTSVNGLLPKQLREIRSGIVDRQSNITGVTGAEYLKQFDALAALRADFDAVEAVMPVDLYPETAWDETEPCSTAEGFAASCWNRVGGFARAAFIKRQKKACWEGIDGETGVWVTAYKEWFQKFGETPISECKKPPPQPPPPIPFRCTPLVSVCTEDFKWGISFSPSVNLGATIGQGLGFNNGTITAQGSGLISVRAFGLGDMANLTLGGGIASTATNGDATNAAPYLLGQLGVGFFSGLVGVSGVLSGDPFNFFPSNRVGYGLSIFVDAAAIARIVGP